MRTRIQILACAREDMFYMRTRRKYSTCARARNIRHEHAQTRTTRTAMRNHIQILVCVREALHRCLCIAFTTEHYEGPHTTLIIALH
jgi:hypothetical protein